MWPIDTRRPAVMLVASMASVELGVTVALIELTLGAGNVFDLRSQEWLDYYRVQEVDGVVNGKVSCRPKIRSRNARSESTSYAGFA